MVENVAKKEVFEAAMQHACSLSSIRRQCVPVPEGTRKYYKVPEGIRKVPVVSKRYQWCQRPQCWCNAHIPQCQRAVCMSIEQCQKAQPICQTRQNNKRALPPLSVGCLLLLELPIYNYLSKVHLYPAVLC